MLSDLLTKVSYSRRFLIVKVSVNKSQCAQVQMCEVSYG